MTPEQEPERAASRLDSNAWLKYVVIPEFPAGTPEADLPRPPGGVPGEYEVTFVLGVPGREVFKEAVTIGDLSAFGDSLLAMPSSHPHLRVKLFREGESGTLDILSNSENRLARAIVQVQVPGFREAEHVAFSVVMPLLSWLSFRHDTGVEVTGYQVREVRSGVIHAVHGILGQRKGMQFDPPGVAMPSTPEHRLLLSTYREALNATSPFYRLLCLYKVIEGIGYFRGQRQAVAVSAGTPQRTPPERMPQSLEDIPIPDELEREKFKPHLGHKFTRVADAYRELYRNAIAHLDPNAPLLVADVYEDVARVQEASTVLQYVAREMLKNELAPHLQPAGVQLER